MFKAGDKSYQRGAKMRAKLFCRTGKFKDEELQFLTEVTIGAKPGNDLVLKAKEVSKEHAKIFLNKHSGSYFLEDLGSKNGTWLDGARITEPERLDNLHVITFAKEFDFVFKVLDVPERKQPKKQEVAGQKTTIIEEVEFGTPELVTTKEQQNDKTIYEEEMPVAEIPDKGKKAEVLSGKADVQKTWRAEDLILFPDLPEEKNVPAKKKAQHLSYNLEFKGINETFTLNEGENVVGRTMGCDILIDEPSLSRRHAIISVKSGVVSLKDLGSTNHTLVNSKKIESEVNIKIESKIRFGDIDAALTAKTH